MAGNPIRKLFVWLGVKADDEALKKFGQGVDDAKEKMRRAGKQAQDFNQSLARTANSGVASLRNGLMGLVGGFAAIDMVQTAEQADGVTAAFESLGGTASDLERLTKATRNLVPEGELTKMANKAKLFGLSTQEVEQFAEIAVGASVATGETVGKMFDDILTAASRNSPLIADNLGLVINQTKANEAYAKKLGKSVSRLSDEEKSLAFRAALVESGYRQRAIAQKLANNEIAQTRVAVDQLRSMLGKLLKMALAPLLRIVSREMIPRLKTVVGFFERWTNNSDEASGATMALTAATRLLLAALQALAVKRFITWVIGLARGAHAASVALRAAYLNATILQKRMLKISLTVAKWLALALVLEDIYVWLIGGDSALGRLIDRLKESEGVLGDIARFLDNARPAILQFFKDAWSFISGALASIQVDWSGLMASVMSGGRAAWGAVKRVVAVLVDVVPGALSNIFGLVTKIVPVVVRVTSRVLGTIVRLGGALVAALTPILGAIIDVAAPILDELSVMFEQVAGPLGEALGELGSALLDLFKALAPIITSTASLIINAFRQIAPLIVQLVGGIVNGIKRLAPLIAEIFMALFKVATKILPIIVKNYIALVKLIIKILPYVIKAIAWILKLILKIVPIVVALITNVVKAFVLIIKFVGRIAAKIAELWLTYIYPIFAKVSAFIIKVDKAILQFILRVVGWLASRIIPTIENIIGTVVVVATAIIKIVTGIIEFLTPIVETFVGFWTALADFVSDAIGAAVDVAMLLIQPVLDLIDGVFSKIDKAKDKLGIGTKKVSGLESVQRANEALLAGTKAANSDASGAVAATAAVAGSASAAQGARDNSVKVGTVSVQVNAPGGNASEIAKKAGDTLLNSLDEIQRKQAARDLAAGS